MKRNARYRGQRESEKYLLSHQEQVYDIHMNYVDIDQLTKTQNELTASWFHNEKSPNPVNITYAQEKTFETNEKQSNYPIIPGMPKSSFSNIVVKLNGATLNLNSDYTLSNGYLILNKPVNGTCQISYVITTTLSQSNMTGLYDLKLKLQMIDERLGEIERKRQSYENTY